MRFVTEKLAALIEERFNGDQSRLPELFDSREVLNRLKVEHDSADWYHFEPATYDGIYLVETADGFKLYEQERGMRSGERTFTSLREAASAAFA